MKKLIVIKVSIVAILLTIVLVLPIKSYAWWVLYDDFESYDINWENLWDKSGDWDLDSTAGYIENGKLKLILHYCPNPDCSRRRIGLSFKQYTEEIKAIKVKVKIADCTGDGRVKIKGDWVYGTQYEFQQSLNIMGEDEKIDVFGQLCKVDTNECLDISRLYSDNPIDILGEEFVIKIWFQNSKPAFTVRRLGEWRPGAWWVGRMVNANAMTLPTERYYKIDVRSSSGEGTCTVYFDDIKIFIDN